MTDMERAYAFGTWAMAKTPMCATCAHYVQHYARRRDGVYQVINCGHCTNKRLKKRLPHNLCDDYTPSEEVQSDLYYPKGYSYCEKGKEA